MAKKSSAPRSPIALIGANAKRLWRLAHAEYEISSEHHLQILAQACACIDSMDVARAALRKDGHVFLDRFKQPKEHPAVELWCKSSRQFLRAIRELGLDLASEPEQYLRGPGVRVTGRRSKER